MFIPAERCIPKVRIQTRQIDVLVSKRIVVAIDSWPKNSYYPMVWPADLVVFLLKGFMYRNNCGCVACHGNPVI